MIPRHLKPMIRSMASSQYLRLRGCRGSLPVTASNREIIHAAHRLLTPAPRRAASSREQRHYWLRCILEEHRQAGITYHAVVTGQL